MQATAAIQRRVPTLATVEHAYAVFQIKRDISELNWWQQALFKRAWLPLMRFCVNRLGLPLVEKLDQVRCPKCNATVQIEGGGCWTEKEGIVTTREMAVEALQSEDWYFHKLTVNAPMDGKTAKRRLDHDFPLANTKSYRKASSDAYEGSLSELEKVVAQAREVTQRATRLNSA